MTLDSLYRAPARVPQLGRLLLGLGAVGVVAAGIGAFTNPRQFYFSWLIGFMLCLGLGLGSMGLLMVQYLTGGLWGLVTRRVFEASLRTLPFLLLLFVPILFGMADLYPWSRPEVMRADRTLQQKALYLNVPFFVVRAAVYFACWLALAWVLQRWGRQADEGDPTARDRLRRTSAGGIVLYGVTITFAAIDWVMSLEPHWFSSIFGLLFITGQGLSAISLSIVVVGLLSGERPFTALLTRKVMLDLGNLLLAFTMLWAYMSFSQFLIIWSANLPEEIPFFLHRLNGGWQWVAGVLVVFHFAVPFLALLMRATKRAPTRLAVLAGWMIVMRYVDLVWFVGPEAFEGHFGLHWTTIVLPAALVALWAAVFARGLSARPIVPVHEVEAALAEMEA
jgi:hypothetical protein